MSSATVDSTPATTSAPANGKPARKKLPPVPKVFKDKAALDAGQKDAVSKGHDYDTRKFRVTSQDGRIVAYVLGYSQKDAAGRAAAEVDGFMKVEELDPNTSQRAPFQMNPETAVSKIQGMSPEDQAKVFAALQKLQGAQPAKPAQKK